MRLEVWNARRYAELRHYETAAKTYLALFDKIPQKVASKYLKEFIAVVEEICADGNCTEQQLLLGQCRTMFPNESLILNACAKLFSDMGYLLKGFEYALVAAENSSHAFTRVNALVNMQKIRSNLIKPWELAVFNNARRLVRYEAAMVLIAKWKPNSNVLVIGTGIGALSSIASRYFKNVHCIEINPNWADIVEIRLEQRILACSLKELKIKSIEIEKVDVVIIDVMSYGILGEKILQTLYSLDEHFLSQYRIFIPKRATAYACIIECPAVLDENFACIGGYRVFSERIRRSYGFFASEIRSGYKILSKAVEIFSINFCSLAEFMKIASEGITELQMAPILRSGTAHAIMAWLSCKLFTGLPPIDSNPISSNNCQQAIFPLPKPIYLLKNSICTLEVKLDRSQLFCVLTEIVIPNDVGSNDSVASSSTALKYSDYADMDDFDVSETNDLLLMNDKPLINFFKQSLDEVQKRRKFMGRKEPMCVLDILNICSISLTLTEANPTILFFCRNHDSSNFYHLFDDALSVFGPFPDEDEICKEQEYKPDTGCPFSVFYYFCMMTCFNLNVTNNILYNSRNYLFKDCESMDALIFWPISSHGFLLKATLDRVLSFRLSNNQASIIPSKISVMGQVVSCPDIVQRCKSFPTAYQGVDMSKMSNLALSFYYGVEVVTSYPSLFHSLNKSNDSSIYESKLKHDVFSDPFELISLRFDQPLPAKESDLPEFMCLFEMVSEVNINADGIADGLLYWFDVESGAQTYSTRSCQNLSKCAIYLFDESRKVTKNENLVVKSSNFRGDFVFEVS
ncbi:unnamed protein product [Thelazia callipaeda]|uniref:Protein arginine N-methyltransferase n=1 Tax=Thelazia callipaeda TaxID=103827 RepID=A0A0N5CP14_THECL|nr:unnamed protein product [Thelazia callipaeda]